MVALLVNIKGITLLKKKFAIFAIDTKSTDRLTNEADFDNENNKSNYNK